MIRTSAMAFLMFLKGNTWKYELIMMCQMAKEMNKPK